MVFDKDYNPLKKPEGPEASDEEEDHEGMVILLRSLISEISYLCS